MTEPSGPDASPRSPTITAFPGMVAWLKVAGTPVAGPWPPHQQPRPDPDDEALPVAIAEPRAPRPPRAPDEDADRGGAT